MKVNKCSIQVNQNISSYSKNAHIGLDFQTSKIIFNRRQQHECKSTNSCNFWSRAIIWNRHCSLLCPNKKVYVQLRKKQVHHKQDFQEHFDGLTLTLTCLNTNQLCPHEIRSHEKTAGVEETLWTGRTLETQITTHLRRAWQERLGKHPGRDHTSVCLRSRR